MDIAGDLPTEEDIMLFIEASIDEAKNDTDPIYLANALATAAEARRRLAEKENDGTSRTDKAQEIAFNDNLSVREFNKTALAFGYHVTLSPVA